MYLAIVGTLVHIFVGCHLVIRPIHALHNNEFKLLCSDEFCDDYRVKHPCPDIDEICFGSKPNASGTFFPSATPCNCCESCSIHLKKGEDCSLGAPGSPVPHFYCGPYLKCRKIGNDSPTCLPIVDTECTREQIEYDATVEDESIGKFVQRPECDENGNYSGHKCISGGICYCIDKDGQRIFGEAVNTPETATTMNCECSRISAQMNQLIDAQHRQYSSRCLDDGSFDPLQCIGDRCMCVNQTNALAKSRVYTIGGVMGMQLSQLPCFNRVIHHRKSYLHDCESVELNRIAESMEFERNGFIVLNTQRWKCDPNGWYARIQHTTEYKFCANKFGNQIEEFRVKRNSAPAQNMNCYCAIARDKMGGNGDAELPECCPNGNYPKVDCRRGYCFCVDANGIQIGRDVGRDELNTLSCYNKGVWC